MNILVIGATGFMGQKIVPLIKENGHRVVILVRNKEKAIQLFKEEFEIRIGDMTDAHSLIDCCKEIDVVINLAALMGHDLPSDESFKKFRKVNVEGLQHLIEDAKKHCVKKFIHISSTAALGLQHVKMIDEDTHCKPYTPYQVTKREGELMLLDEYKTNNFPVVILRPSMVYGPGFKGDFLTIAKVCKLGIFPKIGCGENLSPALYIDDLAEIVSRFVEKGKIGEIYLVSSRQSYSLKETVEIISTYLNKRVIQIYCPKTIAVFLAFVLEKICCLLGRKPIVTKRNIQSVSTDRIININKMEQEIGYVPLVTLKEGLVKTLEYYKKEKFL